jgi:hypothetical protein
VNVFKSNGRQRGLGDLDLVSRWYIRRSRSKTKVVVGVESLNHGSNVGASLTKVT